MDTSRNDLLGELASDAALERGDFLVQATDQLRKFLESNRERVGELGGLTLIDEDPDYLSIAPDLTFRSRTREFDDATGQWVSETEVIESAAELVELYNPADIYQAFAEAARAAGGLGLEPSATEDMLDRAAVGVDETFVSGTDPYAAAADEWAATQPPILEADDDETAAKRLYDLALEFQERSQRTEGRLLDQFEASAANLTGRLGDLIIVDDDDERLTLTANDGFQAEVVPEDAGGEWRSLQTPEELVEYYDPTDVFGDLADALAEAWPSVAPEEPSDGEVDLAGEGRAETTEAEAPAGAEPGGPGEESGDDDDADDGSRNGHGGAPAG